jgi:anti-sigma factor RsiW
MIDRTPSISEDELHAFVDGELGPDRRAAVEAWLASHPEDAARVGSWRAQAEMIHARYGGSARAPVPARLSLENVARLDRKWTWLLAASVLLAFLGGGATGWFGRALLDANPATQAITLEALNAHKLYIAEVRHPIEVSAQENHLLPWLSRRVGSTLRAPDLSVFGLKFMGGRLLPGPSGQAAAFMMYEGSSGERYTFYCSRSAAPESALRYRVSGPIAAVYWGDGEVGFVVSGPADRDKLIHIAQVAYEQLDRRTTRGNS